MAYSDGICWRDEAAAGAKSGNAKSFGERNRQLEVAFASKDLISWAAI